VIVVLVAKIPEIIRQGVFGGVIVAKHTPMPLLTVSETTFATNTPFAATPTQTVPQPTPTLTPGALIHSTVTPTPLTGEMTATPVPSSSVTITVTAEQVAALIQERAESSEIADDDGPELTMRDPVVHITDEYVELTGKAGSPGFGDIDFHVVGVPLVEDGELHFHVTAATVNGIPLPKNMVLEMGNGLGQMLSQALSGGCEVQEVILSDGLITLVTLP
jgi:hypothetical protein